MKEELNKKLAEWVGFENEGGRTWWEPGVAHRPWNQYYEKYRYLPNFTESLDACFKWLVPKLTRIPYLFSITLANIRDGWYCKLVDLSNNPFIEKRIEAEAEVSALALCRAIEKLIDGEK